MFVLYLISFFLVFSKVHSSNESCYQNTCFTIGKSKANYSSASEECKKLNLTLAFIVNETAQLFLQEYVGSTVDDFYIGLRYIPNERFIWESNSNIIPKLNWLNTISKVSSESCVYLLNGVMNISACNETRNYVCSNSIQTDLIATNNTGKCPNGFFRYLNKCYKMNLKCNDESKQWKDAQAECKSYDRNSNLVVVNSMIEQEFLTALMTKSPQAVWTGLHHLEINKIFKIWINENNTMPRYSINFKKNEPNNMKNEKCLMVYHRLSDVGRINDENCSKYLNYLCESPLIITNSTENNSETPSPLFYRGKCNEGYFEFNETCYKVFNTSISYKSANDKCKGKLLYVYGFIDIAFIRSLMALQRISSIWINVNDSAFSTEAQRLQNENKDMKNKQINITSCYYISSNEKGLLLAASCLENHPFICYYFLDNHEKVTDNFVCPLNWMKVGKKCFQLKMNLSTFSEGIHQCKMYNGKLATLTNMKEVQAFGNMPMFDSWIGLNGTSFLSDTWIDGSKLEYCLFRHTGNIHEKVKNNPNSSCFIHRLKKGEWSINPCSSMHAVICEQPATENVCPRDFHINIDGDCYGEFQSKKTWEGAEKFCQNSGGNRSHLSSFHSWEQESLLFSKLNNSNLYWIGLRIYDSTKRWADKSPFNYQQIKFLSSIEFSEGLNCYSSRRVSSRDQIWWHKENCGVRRQFLCKISNYGEVVVTPNENITKQSYYCPKGFVKHGLSCFKIFEEPSTWKDADTKCRTLFNKSHSIARLARFDNINEYESVLSSLRTFNNSVIWIGLYQDRITKQYLWVDEKPFEVLKTVHNGSENGEDTVAMELSMNPFINGRWLMLARLKNFPFICRVDPHEKFIESKDNLITESFTNVTSNCRPSFIEYDENCYYYNNEFLSFNNANKKCKEMGANLLILNDAFEEHFVRSFLSNQNSFPNITWIGLKVERNNILQNWTTTKNSPVFYTHWRYLSTYQSYNTYNIDDNGKYNTEGCFVLRFDLGVTSDNGMAQSNCEMLIPSICKYTKPSHRPLMNESETCATSINGSLYRLDVRKSVDNEPCVRWDLVMHRNLYFYHLNTRLISSMPFNKAGYISYSLDRCSEFIVENKIHGYSCYIFKENNYILKNCLLIPCFAKKSDSTGHPFIIIISLVLIISALCFLIYVYRRSLLSIYRVRVFMASVLGRYQPDWLRDPHTRSQTGTTSGTGFVNPIYTPLESRY